MITIIIDSLKIFKKYFTHGTPNINIVKKKQKTVEKSSIAVMMGLTILLGFNPFLNAR